jgi:hypothetical protein
MADIHILETKKGEKVYTYRNKKEGFTAIGVAKSRKEFLEMTRQIRKELEKTPWVIPHKYEGAKEK